MRVITLLLLIGIFVSPVLAQSGSAQQETLNEKKPQNIEAQLQELMQRISILEEKHAAQVDSLKHEIQLLNRSSVATTESKDEKSTGNDLEALRRAAMTEADKEASVEQQPEETTFKSGNLGLQAMNPEISVTGDMLHFYREGDDVQTTSDVVFRGMGLHFEAYLDPYSRFKAAIPVDENGAELGEVYFTRYGVVANTNVTLGKFRQQFGVVNRWHKHALDWFDFPLALRMVFGPGGLNQTGLAFDWNGAIGQTTHELILQATDGDNPLILGQNEKNRPSLLAHYKIYKDLSPSTYVELGGTGFVGWNDKWETTIDTTSKTMAAFVYGVDLTLAWEPLDRMRYRNIEWRSEAYIVDKEILAPDGSGKDHIKPWGFYSSLLAKLNRRITVNLRFDYYQPEIKEYANFLNLSPSQIVTTADAYRQQTGINLTWFQSPFVKFRVGYAYASGRGTGADENTVRLQMVFAAGPHKHERY